MPYTFKSGEDKQILQQESEAILKKFDNSVAWELGTIARELLTTEFPNSSAVIDITLANGHKLFRAAIGNDTQLDNESWVSRKWKTVMTYNHSSFYLGAKLQLNGKPPLAPEFASHGGSFPIRIEGSNFVIAAITISGLAQEEDHSIAYKSLKKLADLQ